MIRGTGTWPGRLARAGVICLAAGVIGGGPGCGSVYHDVLRERSVSATDWLATRAEESLEMHRGVAGMLADAAAAFDDAWLLDHQLLLWKRLEDRRYEASGALWEARKRTSSIGDVLRISTEHAPGAAPGELTDAQREAAERAIASLDEAADRLDESLAALTSIVDTWKGEMTADDFDTATISAPLAGVAQLLSDVEAGVAAIRAAE